MSIRNKLLADIVVASGGTVTDPHVQNRLLEDWLDALNAVPLPVFDYEAVVFIGDSITAQSAQNKEVQMQGQFDSVGFAGSVQVYGTGMSGHSTKTFTEAWVEGIGQTPNRTLAEYEVLLAGKKTLFISVLGANDVNKFSGTTDYSAVKAEVELWTGILVSAINDSSLNATVAIASIPYVDWRAGMTSVNPAAFDIIDGLAPDYDQLPYMNDVVVGLCQSLTPTFYNNGFIFDFYTETRNKFRYWHSNSESVHPSQTSSELYGSYFSELCWALNQATYVKKPLYGYADTGMVIGDKAVITFDNTYLIRKEPANELIINNCLSAGIRSSSMYSAASGKQFGRTWFRTSLTSTTDGRGNEQNAGDVSAMLTNDTLLRKNTYVREDDIRQLFITGLVASSTYIIAAAASYNSATATLKLGDGLATIEIPETRGAVLGDVPSASAVFTATIGGEITLNIESLDGLGLGIVAGLSIERIT